MSRLRAWRTAKNLSQAEFGAQIGVSSVAVGRYEAGRVPEPDTLQKIIDVTGGDITANDFFELPETSVPSAKRTPRKAAA